MDAAWFKQRQKEVGVTAQEIAEAAGRHRSQVSHILTGRQRMSLDWAEAFARVLQVPVAEVLRRAGRIGDSPDAAPPGFAEGDASPFVPAAAQTDREELIASAMGGGGPGVDVWTVRTAAMALEGYLPGDRILVDSHAADRARTGDTVLAQVYDARRGTAETVLRRFEPPVLVAASPDPAHRRVHVVDGANTLIRGRVIASWRS